MPQLGLDGTVFDGLPDPDPDPYLMYRYADPKHCYLNTWINKANLSCNKGVQYSLCCCPPPSNL